MTTPDLPAKIGNTGVLSAVTPGGLPYPVSSDPANQGANAIKALALALDPQYTDANQPQTPSQNIPSAAWTLVPCPTIQGTYGTIIVPSTAVAGGFRFLQAGRFFVEGHISFVSNATGRRGVGFSANTGGPGTNRMVLGQGPTSGTATIAYSCMWQANVNTEVLLMAYQDSGAALDIQSRGMRVTML